MEKALCIDYETDLIYGLLCRKAGFNISCTNKLSICYEDVGKWIVEWEEYYNPHDNNSKSEMESLSFSNPERAAECFVELRRKAKIGADFKQDRSGYYILGKDLDIFKKKYMEQ